jgi:uncharacterized protein (DUF2267 family)
VVTFEQFVADVRRRARLDSDGAAESASRATLRVLAERLPAPRREALGRALPAPLCDDLARPGVATRNFPVREFFNRVARADVCVGSAQQARPRAAAVIATLRDTLPVDLYDDLVDQLPPDYYQVLDAPTAA